MQNETGRLRNEIGRLRNRIKKSSNCACRQCAIKREERDRRFAAQDQKISILRQQVEELQQKLNGQSENYSEERNC